MSMIKFRCKNCRKDMAPMWRTRFKYVTSPDHYLDVPAALGWCGKCENIEVIEHFPEVSSLARKVAQLTSAKRSKELDEALELVVEGTASGHSLEIC